MSFVAPGHESEGPVRGTRSDPKAPASTGPAVHPSAAFALQRQAGNRAVTQMIAAEKTPSAKGSEESAESANEVPGPVLEQFGAWAREVPGYDALGVALGKDLITERPVARDATAVVGAVAGLVPGGAAVAENLR